MNKKPKSREQVAADKLLKLGATHSIVGWRQDGIFLAKSATEALRILNGN